MSKNYVDVKHTIWQRIHFKDDADMDRIVGDIERTGDAEELYDEEYGFEENEVLYDTAEFIPAKENQAPTIEVYENYKLIYENWNDEDT